MYYNTKQMYISQLSAPVPFGHIAFFTLWFVIGLFACYRKFGIDPVEIIVFLFSKQQQKLRLAPEAKENSGVEWERDLLE
jgi:hypothetical protein